MSAGGSMSENRAKIEALRNQGNAAVETGSTQNFTQEVETAVDGAVEEANLEADRVKPDVPADIRETRNRFKF